MEGNLNALTMVFTEFYYWVTIVMMFLIHVGFCTYEVGVSRRRNHLKTLMKNAMAIPLVTITFYFFGWWIYFAFVNGPGIVDGGLVTSNFAEPWSPLMAHPSFGRQSGRGRRHAGRGRLLAPPQRRFLGRVPALLHHHRLDHLGLDHRAREVERLLDHCRAHRLGALDPRRLVGLAPAGLDGQALGLPRRLCVGRRACDRRRRSARLPDRARPAHRQVPGRRHAARHPAPQYVARLYRPVPDLHRLLGLLRGLQHPDDQPRGNCRPDHRADVDGDQHLPRADHAFGHHLQLPDVAVGRHARPVT